MMANNLPSWDETVEIKSLPTWDETKDTNITTSPTIKEIADKAGIGEALLGGFKQGSTLGFSDELGGGLEALGSILGIEGLGKSFSDMGFQKPVWLDPDKTIADEYREGRDSRRAYNKKLREDQSGAFLTGELSSAAVPGLGGVKALGGVTKGAGLAKKLMQGSKLGAAEGAVAGLGMSEKDTLAGQAGDVLSGAAVGGLAGGLITGGVEGVKGAGKIAKDAVNLGLDITTPSTKASRKEYFNALLERNLDESADIDSIKDSMYKVLPKIRQEVDRVNTEANNVLKNDSFSRELSQIQDSFDGNLKKAYMENPAMPKDTRGALEGSKEKFDVLFEKADLVNNEYKIKLGKLANDISSSRSKFDNLQKQTDEMSRIREDARRTISKNELETGSLRMFIDEKTGLIPSNIGTKMSRANYGDKMFGEENILEILSKNKGITVDEVVSVANRNLSENQDLMKIVDELNKGIVDNVKKTKSLTKDILDKDSQVQDIENSIKRLSKDVRFMFDDEGLVSGKNLKALSTELAKKLKVLKGDRLGPLLKGDKQPTVPEVYLKDVQSDISEGMLKGRERVYTPGSKFPEWKTSSSATPEQIKYGELMDEASPLEFLKTGMEKTVKVSKPDQVNNVLMKIVKKMSDPKYKGTIASIIKDLDEKMKSDVYQRLEDLRIVKGVTGDPSYSKSFSRSAQAGNLLAGITGKATKGIIKGAAKTYKTPLLKALRDGNFKKLGKYAPQVIEALQSGGIPAVISLEYTLQQQDPQFQKTISE